MLLWKIKSGVLAMIAPQQDDQCHWVIILTKRPLHTKSMYRLKVQ